VSVGYLASQQNNPRTGASNSIINKTALIANGIAFGINVTNVTF
jgi:hypothetical protein